VWQLEQNAARAGLFLEQRLQEVAAAAGDVGDLVEPREVVAPEDRGDLRVGVGRHRLVEDAGDVRVRRHVREEAFRDGLLDGRVTGSHRVLELAIGAPHDGYSHHANEGAHRLRMIRPKDLRRGGMSDPAILDLEDAMRREQADDAEEGVRVHADARGESVRPGRLRSKSIRDPDLRRYVQTA
jgi:hypothetical protein